MRMTKNLEAWIREHCGVKGDADESELKTAAGTALVSGDLTQEKFAELSQEEEAEAAHAFSADLKGIGEGITKLTELLTDKAKAEADAKGSGETETTEGKTEPSTKEAGETSESNKPGWLTKMIGRLGDGTNSDGLPRVKGAWEAYNSDKSAALYPSHTKRGEAHPMAGRPMHNYSERGRAMDLPSDLDKAVSGSYAKLLCATAQRQGSRTFGFQSLPEHDRELLYYAMENYKWSGSSDGGDFANIIERNLTPHEQKALIDDAASGGLEAAPIVFDDQVIQTPLLHGELFPKVNIVPLDRGRRVEGVVTGTVTGTWGGIDDTAISLFNTAGYVTAFDTTIFRWEGAIVIGLDFLSDTPIDFNAHITAQYGERLLEDLDDVVATGNGTTQPEGVMNKSGVTSVSFGSTTATLGAYETLRFGVAKPEHRSNLVGSAVFCGTETSYQRARAIPVGTNDARRLGGMDYDKYQWMERPYAINESLTNAQIFYAILARYRMYRRRGLTMRSSTEGDTLIRNNELLIVATARYGGQLERGAVAALTTTAEA